MFFFFFSSRRRHTRWNCDWSSDVCSSDLVDRARRIAYETREVHDGGRPVHGLDELDDVRRVALDELEARVREEVPDRLPAEHERVENAHPPALSEELLDDVRADVAAAADHEDGAHQAAHEGRPDGL